MATAYDMFYNPDGTYKTSAQYYTETEAADLSDLDTLTTAQLCQRHGDLFGEHTRRYDRCAALPVLHPAYPAAKAAMDEIGEAMHAVYAVIQRREAEKTANV